MLESSFTMSFLTSKRFTFTWTLIKGYILDSNIRIEVTWTMLYVTEERTIRLPLQTLLLYYLVDTLNQKLFFPTRIFFLKTFQFPTQSNKNFFSRMETSCFGYWLIPQPLRNTPRRATISSNRRGKKVFLSGQVDWKKWTFDQAFLNN